ncbi:hypothetical protein [Photobacterium halotolerans]|uniref:hypothetical protein n=1 Tax=Photobacterium halotolerans TaxID=265726 RepID=UPI0004831000|nr:hypothetical protein [Photobacterium halotolerans]
MFFNRRKKYNGKVAALLPAFGFDLEEAGVMKTVNVLDIAWNQKYSEYEGAIYVAYLVFSGMLKAGDTRANEVMGKIEYVQNDWLSKGLVRKELASRFLSKAKEWTQGEVQSPSQGGEFSPNMPDIMQSEPVSVHTAGQYLMLLVEDVPSIGERMAGTKMPLRFPYVLAVMNSSNNQLTMFITLEVGFTDSVFLCVFDAAGTHSNLGSGEPYIERHAFEQVALEIACQSLKLDASSVVKASG